MAREHMAIDEQFREVLTRGLLEDPPLNSRRVDTFIGNTLNHNIVGPICDGALRALSQYEESEVRGMLEKSDYKILPFPVIVFLDGEGHIDKVKQYALSYFFATYDSSPTAQNRTSPALIERKHVLQTAKNTLSQEVEKASLPPERRADLKNSISILERQLAGIEFAQANYDQFISDFAQLLPQFPDDRDLFMQVAKKALLADEYVNYPQSHPASTLYHSPAQAITSDPDYENHFLGNNFTIANWCKDETVTKDLLTTANIMLTVLPGLKELSAQIAPENVEFVLSEMARAKDAPFEYSLLMAYAEGILTIVQATNIALGQQINETNNTEEETIVHQILQSQVPQQMARYIPTARVGTTSVNGRYIKGLLVEDGKSVLSLNKDFIALGKEEKLSTRRERQKTFGSTLSSTDAYLERPTDFTLIALSNQSGNVCPVSSPSGIDKESQHALPSYIEYLSTEFRRIFTIVRVLRQKGIAIN